MTYKEAKDIIAQVKWHVSFQEITDDHDYDGALEICDEAAQLFADSQYNHALTDIEGIIEKDKDAVGLLRKSVLIEELKRLKR